MKEYKYDNGLGDQIYDVKAEWEYYQDRRSKIANYPSEFLIERATSRLCDRYLMILATTDEEDMEFIDIRNLAKDALIDMGLDDYSLDAEVEDFKMLFNQDKSKNSHTEYHVHK